MKFFDFFNFYVIFALLYPDSIRKNFSALICFQFVIKNRGSGSVLVFSLKCWIRNLWIRIGNPAPTKHFRYQFWKSFLKPSSGSFLQLSECHLRLIKIVREAAWCSNFSDNSWRGFRNCFSESLAAYWIAQQAFWIVHWNDFLNIKIVFISQIKWDC